MSSLNQNLKSTNDGNTNTAARNNDPLKQYTNFPTSMRDTRNKEYLDKKHLRKKTFEKIPV